MHACRSTLEDPTWAALSHTQIAEPGTGRRFEEALAEQNGWTSDFAERVADEYSGFLYLAATAGFEVTPSQAVDQAWHLHLEWPHYREILCREIIGRTLDHRPGTGEPEDEARCRRQYEQTLALYEQVFGKPPPADIWPRPTAADEGEAEEPDPEEWQSRTLSGRVAFGSLLGSVTLFAFGAPVFGILLAGAALFFFIGAQAPASARGRNSGSCGGGGCGGGGGGGSSSDDCGASCGGASCGGGSCGGGCGGD